MKCWYVVQTKARQEAVARDNLARQDYATYLPVIRTARRRQGRTRPTVEPLFPGYLFVEVDPGAQSIAPIRSTRGAVGLVRFGGRPKPVDPLVIDRLRDAQGEETAPVELGALMRPGDEVTLVEGALAGLRAIVRARTGTERVCVLLDMLGRTTELMVHPSQLVPG